MGRNRAKAAGQDDGSIEAKVLAAVETRIIAELLEPVDAEKLLGPKARIYYYRESATNSPAKTFLEDELPDSAQASYAALFTMHCNGVIVRGKSHHVWDGYDGLWEYKHKGSKTRIMHTMERGNIYVLLFGFGGKKEDKVDTEHVNRAVKMRAEFKRRRDAIEAEVRRAFGKQGGGTRG